MAARAEKRVTISDVARHSGVSIATVSYVLNDRPDKKTTPATRDRVLAAAEELGYVPNAAAAALRRGHSKIVLIVVDPTYTGEVSGRTIEYITGGVGSLGYTVLVHTKTSEAQLCDTVRAVQPFGVVLLTFVSADTHTRLTALGAQHVLGLTPLADADQEGDRFWERNIGAAQVSHLAERGHQHIGYVLLAEPSPRLSVARSRLSGAIDECTRRGLPTPTTVSFRLDRNAIAGGIPALLSSGITAVCVHEDRMGLAVLAALTDLGLSAPADLAVMGADNTPESRLATPQLSSAWIPDTDYGRHARQWLSAVTAGEHVDAASMLHSVLPPAQVAHRQST
ncbi:LacI family transcriptional regulator [Streptomyces sp. NBC_01340]|uniref:LacI family DNA-binding transcriptional regulator n=1 Tax=unclassified Streptomyces TaxID=2593676 RepID=UPI0022587011|nr:MULTISPECIES: LacI family DNA-binding transcriptional regulator [unclassified Streptomyces]MCX4457505.1 LacI family transcriptional regulator [Streptomyces sp. NBC_01719]MCX4496862.1 LacI family transcriptional regulator [Streptomyces sp. NBC_01728]WSI41742.1 LacI family transcriptional regulator [Streptomyces sp. NBC_01340]